MVAVNYMFTEGRVVPQGITEASSTQLLPIGTIVRATDATFGEGEFIYVKGVASLAQFELVELEKSTGVVARSTGAQQQGTSLGVAMSAMSATQWGFAQIGGLGQVLRSGSVAATPNIRVFAGTSTGRVQVTTASGRAIEGMSSANVATLSGIISLLPVYMNRPHTQGYFTT